MALSQRLVTYLVGRTELFEFIVKPQVRWFGRGKRIGCIANTLHSCSNENTEHLRPQSQESPHSLYSTEVFQSVLYTCIFETHQLCAQAVQL